MRGSSVELNNTDNQVQEHRKISDKSTSQQTIANLNNYIKQQQMIQILNKKGIKKLLPVQYETFNLIYQGQDIVAKDRTGSGKTLAFALPTITRMRHHHQFKHPHHPKFLIILPTRQLAIQVKQEINSLKYKNQQDFVITALYGGNGMQEQMMALASGADIVVGTPGRLIDFLERKILDLALLEVICLDEADEMLNIGFKEDIQKIFKFILRAKNHSKIQCLMFSATIPDWIWKISDLYQSKTKKFVDLIKDDNVRTSKTVQHYCLGIDLYDKQSYIGSIINNFFGKKSGKILIFCQTKRQVQQIGTSGMIPVSLQMLHGDFKQFQRQKVFHKFKSGQIQCLIATNVAARGLDFPEIDLIIQMQPPTTTDSYIHRSGRTGRAGKYGACITLYSSNQQYLMQKIQHQAKIIFHHLQPNRFKPLKQKQSYYSKISYRDWYHDKNNHQENYHHNGYSHNNTQQYLKQNYNSVNNLNKYQQENRGYEQSKIKWNYNNKYSRQYDNQY